MGFLNSIDLQAIGFRSLGTNVQISDAARIYGSEQITIGSNVRIDDFCILSAGVGGIELGNHVHIACYSSLIGHDLIRLEDFCGLSARVSIYSSTDDYSGSALTNPTVPQSLRNVKSGPVVLHKHVIVGVGCLILPEVEIGEGSAVGAMSVVTRNLAPFGVYLGAPVRRIKSRQRNIVELEARLREQE